MDPETRDVLFGRSTKLGKRGWAPGATRVFFLEATAQAVVAEMTAEWTLLVRRDRNARAKSIINCFEIDPQKFTFRGKPVFTLTDATRRLESVQKTPASSRIHGRALALTEVFGTTYYLSESVAANLMNGDHYFVVGDKPVARMRWGTNFTINGHKLKWGDADGQKYATLDGHPVYVMVAVGERTVARKKPGRAAANPESCASETKASRGSKSTPSGTRRRKPASGAKS